MTLKALSVAFNVSAAHAGRWKRQGMPTGSVDEARAWLKQHRRRPGRRPGWNKAKAKIAAALGKGPAPVNGSAKPSPTPQAAAAVNGHALPIDTPAVLLGRLAHVERVAFAMIEDARAKGEPILERECVRVHRDAAVNLANARSDWTHAMEKEGKLVSADWVRRAFAQHDGVLVSLLRNMPRTLAARILPSDVEFAEGELGRWVDGFLATMYATQPLPS
jgi:hypothetical protein